MEKKAWSLCFSMSFFILLLYSLSYYPPKPYFRGLSLCTSSVSQIQQLQKPTTDEENTIPHHPLDPLTISEINKVRAILSSYPPFISSFPVIHLLSLEEPDKSHVLSWRKGDPLPPRRASVLARLDLKTHIVTVDLDLGKVTSHTINKKSGYPPVTIDDMSNAVEAALANKQVQESLLQRGLALSDVMCGPPSAGWFGPEEENGRVTKVVCYLNQGTPNFYMRPIEGLTVTVDLDRKKVVKITYTGRHIPVPRSTDTDYTYKGEAVKHPLKPISIEQPNGPSFRVEDGHGVRWANWEFHLKADQRAGLMISRAMVRDPETDELRSVMYKGFSSELFVPYMDPDEEWYFMEWGLVLCLLWS